jgi:CheY-like chemotaxis protein
MNDDNPNSAGSPMTVLVVDDVSDTRRMYGSYFEHVGARVLFAPTGPRRST